MNAITYFISLRSRASYDERYDSPHHSKVLQLQGQNLSTLSQSERLEQGVPEDEQCLLDFRDNRMYDMRTGSMACNAYDNVKGWHIDKSNTFRRRDAVQLPWNTIVTVDARTCFLVSLTRSRRPRKRVCETDLLHR